MEFCLSDARSPVRAKRASFSCPDGFKCQQAVWLWSRAHNIPVENGRGHSQCSQANEHTHWKNFCHKTWTHLCLTLFRCLWTLRNYIWWCVKTTVLLLKPSRLHWLRRLTDDGSLKIVSCRAVFILTLQLLIHVSRSFLFHWWAKEWGVYCGWKSGWESLPGLYRWGQWLGGGTWPCGPFRTNREGSSGVDAVVQWWRRATARRHSRKWDEGLFKGHHKKQYRTAGMVAKEWGEIPKAVQSRKKDTQHLIYLHTIRYSPRLDLSSVKPGAHFCRQTSTSWFSSHTTWKDSNGHRQSER